MKILLKAKNSFFLSSTASNLCQENREYKQEQPKFHTIIMFNNKNFLFYFQQWYLLLKTNNLSILPALSSTIT